MGHGRANNPDSLLSIAFGNARTPGRATDRPIRTDASACAFLPRVADGAKASSVTSTTPQSATVFSGSCAAENAAQGYVEPSRDGSIVPTARLPKYRAVQSVNASSSAGRAASLPGVFTGVIREAAILAGLYVLLLLILLFTGCSTPEIKTARPGIDRATGTAQSLQTSLDTIEYHARELRKEYK